MELQLPLTMDLLIILIYTGYIVIKIQSIRQKTDLFRSVCTPLSVFRPASVKNSCWKTRLQNWSVYSARVGCPHLSEYNSAAGEIPASTSLVWIQGSVFFFFSFNLLVVCVPSFTYSMVVSYCHALLMLGNATVAAQRPSPQAFYTPLACAALAQVLKSAARKACYFYCRVRLLGPSLWLLGPRNITLEKLACFSIPG